ncbi:MAG: sigma-54 dependent transcriptional regulator [Pseudomonadota bacterium]
METTLSRTNPILAVDDEEKILRSIRVTLRAAGFDNVITCNESTKAVDLIPSHSIEVVLLDLTMPYLDGEELLGMINCEFPEIPVIIVTGSVDIETAVRCVKAGAFDYIVKPVEEGRLLSAVTMAVEFRELKRENRVLRERVLSDTLQYPDFFSRIVTNNKKMRAIFQYIESIALSPQPVLITGETGTGKELITEAIHKASGRNGDFVTVNMAGLDDNVFSDTLFGHVKGAFTGADSPRKGMVEQAEGGTLMLDEIGDISQASQVKLLRFLQEGEYLPLGLDRPKYANVRIVSVTNEDIPALIRKGLFRKDLNYRLRTHHIHLPPLRERRDDIPLLMNYFLQEAAEGLQKSTPNVPPEIFTLLRTYSFPGNIRELQAMVFDAMSQHKAGTLSLKVFKSKIADEHGSGFESKQSGPTETDKLIFPENLPTLRQANKLLISEAMRRADSNQSVAALLLGISQQALSRRLQKESDE